jgi:SpoVK/Ycf46/Vps4 family AAA+-type ATPase
MNNNINFKLLLLLAMFYNMGIKSASNKPGVGPGRVEEFTGRISQREYKSWLEKILKDHPFWCGLGSSVVSAWVGALWSHYSADKMNDNLVVSNLNIIYPDKNKINFNDIIAYHEIKNILSRYVTDLKNNKKGNSVLLYGPPGNGKTHFVCALAKEAGVPIISINGNNLITKKQYLLSNIELVFKTVEQLSPCIFFIDELDLLIKNRDRINLSDKQETMLSIFLQKFDGLSSNLKQGVLVVGCTNHIDNIDPAMLRYGRLGEKILIDLPTEKDIQELFEKKCKNYESFRSLFLRQNLYQKMHKHKVSVVGVLEYIHDLDGDLDEKIKQESRQIDDDENEELLESIIIDLNTEFGIA